MRARLPILRDAPALGRREIVQWLGAMAAAGVLPACSGSTAAATPPVAPFLSTTQQTALAALADYFVPPDELPGGAALGVVAYVETLLTALEGAAATIFTGGPYSGRQPFATADGQVGKDYPPDDFKPFVPLDRYRQAAWKLRLYGSAAIPGGGINDAIIGVTLGLRSQVPAALESAMAAIEGPLDATTSAANLALAFNSMSSEDRALITELIIEGCFSSPEYGGNAELAGFLMCNFEGDSQPLGYSLYDESTGTYNQLTSQPVNIADPGPDPDPMDADTLALIKTLVTFAGGQVFY